MKWIIIVLVVCGAAGILAAITGVQHVQITNTSVSIVHHTVTGRVLSLAFGILALIAAHGCKKRREYGWYIVTALLWVSLFWAIFRAVYLAITLDMPWPATLLGGLGEAVKIGIWVWVLFHFWAKQRKSFSVENPTPNPTPAAVTPSGGQEPRHP